MGIAQSILNFLTALISPITEHVKGKREITKAVTQAKIEKVNNGQISDIELDKLERANAGWMDDLGYAITMVIIVSAFIPPALPHILAGFAALEGMPVWFQIIAGLQVAAIWGYRKLVTPMAEAIVKASLLGKKGD